jgi:hypothetical protein
LKLFQELAGGERGWRAVEGGNSSMIYLIYCKNLYKYHNVPPPNTIIKEKTKQFNL